MPRIRAGTKRRSSATEPRILFTQAFRKSKTRLIPVLGPEGAAQLQREMTQHVLGWAKALATCRPLCLEVCFEGGDDSLMRQAFGNDLTYRRQTVGDLGQRMHAAFEAAFRAGNHRAVLIGTDCPELDGRLVQAAFDRLGENDLVLRPANDGGYYLIGLRRSAAGKGDRHITQKRAIACLLFHIRRLRDQIIKHLLGGNSAERNGEDIFKLNCEQPPGRKHGEPGGIEERREERANAYQRKSPVVGKSTFQQPDAPDVHS